MNRLMNISVLVYTIFFGSISYGQSETETETVTVKEIHPYAIVKIIYDSTETDLACEMKLVFIPKNKYKMIQSKFKSRRKLRFVRKQGYNGFFHIQNRDNSCEADILGYYRLIGNEIELE